MVSNIVNKSTIRVVICGLFGAVIGWYTLGKVHDLPRVVRLLNITFFAMAYLSVSLCAEFAYSIFSQKLIKALVALLLLTFCLLGFVCAYVYRITDFTVSQTLGFLTPNLPDYIAQAKYELNWDVIFLAPSGLILSYLGVSYFAAGKTPRAFLLGGFVLCAGGLLIINQLPAVTLLTAQLSYPFNRLFQNRANASEVLPLGFTNVDEPADYGAVGQNTVVVVILETMPYRFVTPEFAPSLSKMIATGYSFDDAYAPANSTHLSWYSIFSGKSPFVWPLDRDKDKHNGSAWIRALKQSGYVINFYGKEHVNLKYLNLGALAYSDGHKLIDRMYLSNEKLNFYVQDRQTVDHFVRDVDQIKASGKSLVIIHLDATHHNYFFDEKADNLRGPFVDKFDYTKTDYSPEEIAGIRNRYINALRGVDGQLGRIKDALPRLGANARLVLVGDHGEEFMENGVWIHGNKITEEQFRVPMAVIGDGLAGVCKRPVTTQEFGKLVVMATGADLVAYNGFCDKLPGKLVIWSSFADRIPFKFGLVSEAGIEILGDLNDYQYPDRSRYAYIKPFNPSVQTTPDLGQIRLDYSTVLNRAGFAVH